MVLGVLAFVAALVAVLPVRWLSFLLPDQLHCGSLQGSLWNGSCNEVSLRDGSGPPLTLQTLRWKLHPAALLRLTISADVSAKQQLGQLQASLSMHRERISLEHLSASGTLDHSLLPVLPVGWSGRLEARDVTLVLDADKLLTLRGAASLHELNDGRGVPYGNYVLEFPPQPNAPFAGQLRDQGGPLDLAARVTVNGDRSWQVDGTITARSGAPVAVQERLRALGTMDAAGKYPLSAAGTFN
jgi:general secretion pathway protein N